jgi:phage antirepressor YoqD-like protein
MRIQNHSYPTISEVAQQFGVSRTRVFTLLRKHDVIGSQGLVRARYLQEEYFRNEQRSRYHPGLDKETAYQVVTVTPKGRSLIQDLIDEANNETPSKKARQS